MLDVPTDRAAHQISSVELAVLVDSGVAWSGYWATWGVPDEWAGESYGRHVAEDGFLRCRDDNGTYRLTKGKVLAGVSRAAALAGKSPRAWIEGCDGPAADVAIQLALFGEVPYG